jgi:hypothetical protein
MARVSVSRQDVVQRVFVAAERVAVAPREKNQCSVVQADMDMDMDMDMDVDMDVAVAVDSR